MTTDVASLARDVGQVVEEAAYTEVDPDAILSGAPKTIVEPGRDGQWVFDRPIAKRVLAIRHCIDRVSDERNRRLMRVLLGAQLVPLSNVLISGKGRRYRRGWRESPVAPDRVITSFVDKLTSAVHDITVHSRRPLKSYEIWRGDARVLVKEVEPVDVVVFSPPYPNSFDYTDVYNLELWVLGYLRNGVDNAQLRQATMCSHVQLKREYPPAPSNSPLLRSVLDRLDARKHALWDSDIPAMVGGYFADMAGLLSNLRGKLRKGGRVHMVVGDSSYAEVTIPVAGILTDLAPSLGFTVIESHQFRSMRASAQQGGNQILRETLVILG